MQDILVHDCMDPAAKGQTSPFSVTCGPRDPPLSQNGGGAPMAAPNETPENSREDTMNFSGGPQVVGFDPSHEARKTQMQKDFSFTQLCPYSESQKPICGQNFGCRVTNMTPRAAHGCQGPSLDPSMTPSDVLEVPETLKFSEVANPSNPPRGGIATQNCPKTPFGSYIKE